jgi:L-ascorbate oxidase
MECRYDFLIEWYEVLSKACLDCPFNKTNCDRKDCVSADGYQRAINTVNRMLPGPSIIVCKGDTIKVNVYNNMHTFQGTSIHWHGLLQRGTPHMDGVGMITQCPIPSYTNFEYK